MSSKHDKSLESARSLMDEFLRRTGISSEISITGKRYLWTDAFAVKNLFGLAHHYGSKIYHKHALRLIEDVHHTLGRHRKDDERHGWISGLPEEEGRFHPTIGGLRIGKELPERKADEPFDESLEWERDGQYFHYLTRWINALLQAGKETDEKKYNIWAAELCQAGEHFTDNSEGIIRMYWKMSIDLSRPVVTSMGAHDPLEGLLCVESALEQMPKKASELESFRHKLQTLCAGRDWYTSDALGLGILMLDTARLIMLNRNNNVDLVRLLKPEKMVMDCINALKMFTARIYDPARTAPERLAFRECGLTLGLRVLSSVDQHFPELNLNLTEIRNFLPLADEIEDFWLDNKNQGAYTWKDHQDINSVSLASSLIARKEILVFV